MTSFVVAAPNAPASLADELIRALTPVLGFEPDVRLGNPDSVPAAESGEVFVLPASLEWNLFQREAIGQRFAEARRTHSSLTIHHDDPDPCDPLIVDMLAERAAPVIHDPRRAAILLTPDGCGDPGSRAQSYRLMRLLWERLGVAAGDVAFVRHAQPFLSHTLDRLDDRFEWIVIPPALWPAETVDYARVILENSKQPFGFAEPITNDERVTAWLASRAIKLWREKRSREDRRERSAKSFVAISSIDKVGDALVARVPDRETMRAVFDEILPPGPHDRVIVKVTWHGYATGTFTDPAALDLLLSALPARAVIVEGHTSSRNLGEASFDWETESRANRAWIVQQDTEFLRRTGLADVIDKHNAQYINITECFWDEDAPDAENYIPLVLRELKGSPLISFAKIKGPTRLAISNLFGLIPEPLRSRWHGPNITYFARVCCDISKRYAELFPLCAINEGLSTAVRWDRNGLYRSRWGNYDLIRGAQTLVASRSIVSADILASRLQSQDVHRSAFFDVVRAELGWDEQAANGPLPEGYFSTR